MLCVFFPFFIIPSGVFIFVYKIQIQFHVLRSAAASALSVIKMKKEKKIFFFPNLFEWMDGTEQNRTEQNTGSMLSCNKHFISFMCSLTELCLVF